MQDSYFPWLPFMRYKVCNGLIQYYKMLKSDEDAITNEFQILLNIKEKNTKAIKRSYSDRDKKKDGDRDKETNLISI